MLNVAKEKGISYPLPEDLSDRKLSEMLFPSDRSKPEYKMPDYEYVHKELQKNGVTLNLLRLEYCEECRKNGELPYQLTQFKKHYRDYAVKTNATMHLNHKPGEILQVKQNTSCFRGGRYCNGNRYRHRRSNPGVCVRIVIVIQRICLRGSILLHESGVLDCGSCLRFPVLRRRNSHSAVRQSENRCHFTRKKRNNTKQSLQRDG